MLIQNVCQNGTGGFESSRRVKQDFLFQTLPVKQGDRRGDQGSLEFVGFRGIPEVLRGDKGLPKVSWEL